MLVPSLPVGSEFLLSNRQRSFTLDSEPLSTILRQQRQYDYSSFCILFMLSCQISWWWLFASSASDLIPSVN